MLCYQLHEEREVGNAGDDLTYRTCLEDIPETSRWKFCPRCGRSTGNLKVITDARFEVDGNKPSIRVIPITNSGFSTINVTVSVTDDTNTDMLRLADNHPEQLRIPAGNTVQVQVRVGAILIDQPETEVGKLKFEISDGPRSLEEDPWEPPELRSITLPITVETRAYDIRLGQDIAIFHDDQNKREILLSNFGKVGDRVSQAQLVDAKAKQCYQVIPGGYSYWPVPGSEGLDKHMGKDAYQVIRIAGSDAPERTELRLEMEKGPAQSVTLYSCPPTRTARAVPEVIVGIDFGTAFTTVAVRPYQKTAGAVDPVQFIEHNGEKRFPTRIWLGFSGEMEFSFEATERAQREDINRGFLLRGIKTLLRDEKTLDFYPLGEDEKRKEQVLTYLKRRSGDRWNIWVVGQYLKWVYETLIKPHLRVHFGSNSPAVQFVFTLPVLDYGQEGEPQYNQQSEKMKDAVRMAGFPVEQTEYYFEPVCAAIGMLTPPPDIKELAPNQFRLKGGEQIALFDSGGGTTDIALLEAASGPNGELQLKVNRCLGVDKAGATFGGETITDLLLEILNKYEKEIEKSGLDKNSITEDTLLQFIEGSIKEAIRSHVTSGSAALSDGLVKNTLLFPDLPSNYKGKELEYRDATETLKIELANGGEQWIERGGTSIDPFLLFELMQENLNSLRDSMIERVFDNDPSRAEQVDYYFCVGGNSGIAPLRQWVEFIMGDINADTNDRRVSLPEQFRKLAVAYGAVFVPDARVADIVPYNLRVLAEVKSQSSTNTIPPILSDVLLQAERFQPATFHGLRRRYRIKAREQLVISVMAQIGKDSEQVASWNRRLASPDQPGDQYVTVVTDLTGGNLEVKYRWDTDGHTDFQSLIKYAV